MRETLSWARGRVRGPLHLRIRRRGKKLKEAVASTVQSCELSKYLIKE